MTEGDMKEIGSLIGRAVRDEDGSAAEESGRRAALVSAHPPTGAPGSVHAPRPTRVDRGRQPRPS
jgi:hypothetical protein